MKSRSLFEQIDQRYEQFVAGFWIVMIRGDFFPGHPLPLLTLVRFQYLEGMIS